MLVIRDVFSQWHDCSCSFQLIFYRSFVSLVISKKFSDAQEALDYPFEVGITNDHIVSSLWVHWVAFSS